LARNGDDGVGPELHQLTCQRRQPIELVVGESALDDEIAALDVAELAQRLGDEVR
jgi:hypothetical protein